MKIPYKWLKDYVKTDLSPKDAANILTMAGHALDKPLFDQGGDTVLDLEDRGNRADVTGIVGIARDLAALTGETLAEPDLSEIPPIKNEHFSPKISVESSKVVRWKAVKFLNVKVQESPDWLKEKLASYGIESKNTVVDITNFVMVETGMPLHAFDLDKVDEIVLRQAKEGESLVTFDGGTLKFNEDDLLACDSTKPLTLTTAVGGLESGVTESTTNVLVEAGLYHQPTVRRTALRLNVRNESSNRLGKYLHPHFCEVAIARIIYLFQKTLNSKVEEISFDYYPNQVENPQIRLRSPRLNLIAGEEIPLQEAAALLKKLSFEIDETEADSLLITVPYFRTDIFMEDDLIEEVLRVRGYSKIPSYMPNRPSPDRLRFPELELENYIKDIGIKLGFNEVISHQIVDKNALSSIGSDTASLVELENSWNEELNAMRPTLFISMQNYLSEYHKHKIKSIRLLETGKIYHRDPNKTGYEKYSETRVAALLSNLSYLELKGHVESLLEELGILDFSFQPHPNYLLKKGISAKIMIGDVEAGFLGEVKTKILDTLSLPSVATYCELSIPVMLPHFSRINSHMASSELRNSISESLTVSVANDVKVGELLKKMSRHLGDKGRVTFKDVFRDSKLVSDNKKSVTLSLRLYVENKDEARKILESLKQIHT